MVETGTYVELLESSSSFRHLLENKHQQEQAIDTDYKQISRCITFSEIENDEAISESTNIETREQGSISWRVYISYMQAGAGLIFSLLFIILGFGIREGISVFYSWWLAEWSKDESHRHRHFNNCTEASITLVNRIQSMNETEWNYSQQRRFHIYSGLFIL